MPKLSLASDLRLPTTIAALLMAVLSFTLAPPPASAGEHRHAAPGRIDSHHHHDGVVVPPELSGPGFYSEIGIDITPELEHWPSNYQPDSYRLRGYDGRDNGEHFCDGAHGRTLSSSGTECPPDQRNKAKKRSYSTEAN